MIGNNPVPIGGRLGNDHEKGQTVTAEIEQVDRPRTKSQMARAVAELTGYATSDVNRMIDGLVQVVEHDLSPGGVGSVTIAGLVKIDIQAQTARPERMGRNPATGESITIPAREAVERGKVRVRALKRLRDIL